MPDILSVMMRPISALIIVFVALLAACGGDGKSTYYWQKNATGASQFSRDHNDCMEDADAWPFTMPRLPNYPESLNLRLRHRDNSGVWAYYVPRQGVQPVYVNYAAGDWSIDSSDYARCMRRRGYGAAREPYVGREIGIVDCDALGKCYNPPQINWP